jgi:hypothetical protein
MSSSLLRTSVRLTGRLAVASLTTFSSVRFASTSSTSSSSQSQSTKKSISPAGPAINAPFVLIAEGTNIKEPSKKRTEDAFFTSEKAIGVADGVGGWAAHGIDAVSTSSKQQQYECNAD